MLTQLRLLLRHMLTLFPLFPVLLVLLARLALLVRLVLLALLDPRALLAHKVLLVPLAHKAYKV
jgi:hypothetical protein